MKVKVEVRGQLLAPAALAPRERVPLIHCIGGWVGPRAILINSMEHSPSWEANSHSASQEIPRLLWNPKFH